MRIHCYKPPRVIHAFWFKRLSYPTDFFLIFNGAAVVVQPLTPVEPPLVEMMLVRLSRLSPCLLVSTMAISLSVPMEMGLGLVGVHPYGMFCIEKRY